jgi:hypothetical protein
MSDQKLYYFSEEDNETRNDFAVFCLIFVLTCNPYFLRILGKEMQVLLPAAIGVFWAFHRRIKIASSDFLVCVSFLFVMSVHLLEFGSVTIASSLSMLVKILTGLVVVRFSRDIDRSYILMMYGVSIFSFLFYFPTLAGLPVENLLSSIGQNAGELGGLHVGFYNFKVEHSGVEFLRNPGFFGEPGIFACLIVFALLLAAKNMSTTPTRFFYVLYAALITTQSTTGYIAGAAVFMFLMFKSKAVAKYVEVFSMAFRIAIGVISIVGIIYIFSDSSFLLEKIQQQFVMFEQRDEGWELTRWGNADFDWEFIVDRPLFGWSQLWETRGLQNVEFVDRFGNGLTGFIVRFGFVGFGLFLLFAFRTMSHIYNSKGVAALAVGLIVVMLFGEFLLSFPIFLALMFQREHLPVPNSLQ